MRLAVAGEAAFPADEKRFQRWERLASRGLNEEPKEEPGVA